MRKKVVVRIDHDELTDHDFESIVLSAKAAELGEGMIGVYTDEICAALTPYPCCVCRKIGDAFARVSE